MMENQMLKNIDSVKGVLIIILGNQKSKFCDFPCFA